MNRLLIIFGLLLVVLMVAAGCSDDDECPTCPEVIAQQAIAMGEARVHNGELSFYGIVQSIDGTLPDIDSVKVDGHDVEMEAEYGYGVPVCWLHYSESDGPMRKPSDYSSGDSVTVEIFMSDRTCESKIKLLDVNVDACEVIDWNTEYSTYDTVAIGTEVTVAWHPVAAADRYMVSVDMDYDSLGTYIERISSFETTDTSFTIPASDIAYNGRIYFNLLSMTGPSIYADNGNITGGVVKGIMTSTAYESFRIYVGTGEYSPYNASEDEADDSLRTWLDIARGLQQ